MGKINRRKVLATGAAAGAFTAISPALSKVFRTGATDVDAMLRELVLQFKIDAMSIDPTIKGVWIGHDLTFKGRSNAVFQVNFEREGSMFFNRD